MDKVVFVFAITALVLQSEVYCEECIDDIKVNCEMMASVLSVCTVNKEKAAQLCPKTCNLCHPDGNWAYWSSWSGCSVTCGSSLQTRKRTCTNHSQPNNGTSCKGASEEYKSCLNEPCPVPVAWEQWSEWGICSSTCDAGIQHRDRVCNKPFSLRNDDQCVGVSTEEQICVQRACTDGGWTLWSTWSTCSVTCGGGIYQRTRDCANPPPSAYGRYCPGPNSDVSTCNTQFCPQTAGGWSGWSSWSTCTSSCGGGVHQRHRSCTNPAPSPYGQPCYGLNADVMTCNKHKCASDRAMSAFTATSMSGDNNPLIFPKVELNLGNDYNSATGVFTCRVPGLYFFTVSVQKLREKENERTIDFVEADIQKNGITLVAARSDPHDGVTDTGSYMIGTSCTVHLQRGDTIRIFGFFPRFFGDYCTFTGFLISADIL